VEVHVRHRSDLTRAAELLGQIDHGSVELDEPTGRASVRVDPGGAGLMQAMQAISAAGIEVEDIALRQPNLDEVFLALTGRVTDDSQMDAARAA
jgi:ABC-2 type transport system ATP-binding protein